MRAFLLPPLAHTAPAALDPPVPSESRTCCVVLRVTQSVTQRVTQCVTQSVRTAFRSQTDLGVNNYGFYWTFVVDNNAPTMPEVKAKEVVIIDGMTITSSDKKTDKPCRKRARAAALPNPALSSAAAADPSSHEIVSSQMEEEPPVSPRARKIFTSLSIVPPPACRSVMDIVAVDPLVLGDRTESARAWAAMLIRSAIPELFYVPPALPAPPAPVASRPAQMCVLPPSTSSGAQTVMLRTTATLHSV